MDEYRKITRIEKYLAKIIGEDVELPESPIYREEFYLAKIAGETVSVLPTPITRIDFYLAKIAGENVELPTPITRTDYLLAKVAGEDVETPEYPLSEAEKYLLKWAEGGGYEETTVEGVSPLLLANAAARAIVSLTQYGKVEQDDTPTPAAHAPLICNNGEIVARHESGLPTGCNLLDYVRNSSSTRIDTSIYDDVDDFRIELRVSPSSGSWYICQSRASSNAPIYGVSGANSGNKISFGNGINSASVSSDIARDTSHTYTIIGEHKNGNISLYVKDETTDEEDTQTNTYSTASFEAATSPIGVWGTASNTVNSGNDIYYLRIYKGGEKVADYVPCEKGGENGFWDFVSNSFIGKTAGTINAGSAVADPIVVFAVGTPETISVFANQNTDPTIVKATLATGQTEVRYNNSSSCIVAPVKPNTTYSIGFLTKPSGGSIFRVVTTKDKASSSVQSVASIAYDLDMNNYATKTLNSGAEAAWMYVQLSNTMSAETFASIVIQEGTSLTPPQTATVPNLYAVGNYADIAEIIGGMVNRKVGIYVCDGTESVFASGAGWAFAIADKVKSKVEVLCTHYPYSSATMANAPDKSILTFSSQNIGIKDSAFTSKTDVTDFFAAEHAAGHPMIIIYPLAEETIESVALQPLETHDGDNVITVTANVNNIQIEATYAKKKGA